MLSRILALTVLLASVPFLVGCGLFGSVGADSGSGPDGLPPRMEIIQFDDDLPPDPQLEVPAASSGEEVVRSLVVDPEVLVRVRFLYNLQVRLEGLRRIIRDLSSMLEYSGPGDVDLDWVAEVHEVTREADEYFRVLTSLQVPESQRGSVRWDLSRHPGCRPACQLWLRPGPCGRCPGGPLGPLPAEHAGP